MDSNRIVRVPHVGVLLLAALLAVGICCTSQVATAYGDLTGGSLTVQDGGAKIPLTKDMVSVEADADGKIVNATVSLKYGGNKLKEYADGNGDYVLNITTQTGYIASSSSYTYYKLTIEGRGNYSGTLDPLYYKVDGEEGNWQPAEKTLLTSSNVTVTCDKTEFEYDNTIQKPEVTEVLYGSEKLNPDTDYNVGYSNNESTGKGSSYYVYVYPKGGYVGSSISTSYKIGTPISQAEFTVPNKTYTGSSITFSSGEVKGTYGGKDFTYFTVSSTSIDAGSAVATIKGSGSGDNTFVGTVEVPFTIEPFDLGTSGASVTVSISSQTFTGSALTPDPTSASVYYYQSSPYVYLSKSLVKDTDYTISYSNNTNAGTATATITGKGNYKGTKTQNFTINAASMSSATCSAIPDKTYNGSPIKPAVSNVKFSGLALTEGVDYTVSYGENTNAGSGSVTLTGKGNYSSTKSVSFNINPKSIASSDITVSKISSQSYTGSALTPSITLKDKKTGKKLEAKDSSWVSYYDLYDSIYGGTYFPEGYEPGLYYSIAYANNTNPGIATLTVTGVGNYNGTRKIKFTINGTGTVPKVKATNKGNGQVSLTWNPIYKATKYMVAEKLPDGKYKTLTNSWTSTRCTITNLSVLRKHRFIVRAYVNKKWSSNSDKYLVSIKPTGPSKPKISDTSTTAKAISLTWDAAPGTERYAIYTVISGTPQLLTSNWTSTTASIPVKILKADKKGNYTFFVRACIDGKWSSVNKKDYVTLSTADPNSPTLKAVGGVGKGKVKLSWGKTRNAKKFKVEVKLANGKWKTLTSSCTKLTYTAKGLSSSKSHTFRVRAFGNSKWSKLYSRCYASATPDNA